MVLPEKPLLADSAFIRFDSRMPHLVPSHVRSIGKLHIADVTLKHLPMYSIWGRVVIFGFHSHFIVYVVYSVYVCSQGTSADSFEITSVAPVIAVARIVVRVGRSDVVLFRFIVGGVSGRLSRTAGARISFIFRCSVCHYHRVIGVSRISASFANT